MIPFDWIGLNWNGMDLLCLKRAWDTEYGAGFTMHFLFVKSE
jgi:hypothetical protein